MGPGLTVPLVDRHSSGLNDWLAGEIALGGHQHPGTVQQGVRSCAKAVNAKRRVAKTAPVVSAVENILMISFQAYR